jgi:hypothetical protein
MRAKSMVLALTVLVSGAAVAQLNEVFSRYVQIFKPVGDFTQVLIKQSPGSGEGWRLVDDQRNGYRIQIPADSEVDANPAGNRALHVVLSGGPQKPRPVFRVDAFKPEEDDPVQVDEKYAADYADNYSELAFNGKFNYAESGFIVLNRKLNFAMVAGSYLQGAVPCYRMQWAFLSPEKQYFLTFDCPEKDWPRHSTTVARILLSFDLPKKKK